jgi:hypothetical protein
MRGNWNGALTEVWESSLDLAASFAEGYAKLNRRGCGGCRRPACPHCFATAQPHCRSEGDFLADWVQLNLSHVSQVARLSAAYSGVAVRALERFYSCFDPCDTAPSAYAGSAYELCLNGHDTAHGMLTLRNTFGADAVFQIEGIAKGKVSATFTEVGTPSASQTGVLEFTTGGSALSQQTLKPNEVAKFGVSLDVSQWPAGKQYRGTIIGLLGTGSRAVIHVLVDAL